MLFQTAEIHCHYNHTLIRKHMKWFRLHFFFGANKRTEKETHIHAIALLCPAHSTVLQSWEIGVWWFCCCLIRGKFVAVVWWSHFYWFSIFSKDLCFMNAFFASFFVYFAHSLCLYFSYLYLWFGSMDGIFQHFLSFSLSFALAVHDARIYKCMERKKRYSKCWIR